MRVACTGSKPWPAFEAAVFSGVIAALEQWCLDPSPGRDPKSLLIDQGVTVSMPSGLTPPKTRMPR